MVFFILLNVSNATSTPPSTCIAPIINVALSTPLQSPFLIASQFLCNSSMIEVKPCIAVTAPTNLNFPVNKPTPIAMFVRPLIASFALSQFIPFFAISDTAEVISPIPCITFREPPNFVLPNIVKTSPMPPANSERIPVNVGPLSSISFNHFLSSLISDKKLAIPIIDTENDKFFGVKPFIVSKPCNNFFDIFHAAKAPPILPTTANTPFNFSLALSIFCANLSFKFAKASYSGRGIPKSPPRESSPRPFLVDSTLF